ncbi:MAG TPA: HepT-like ribonuclease domain-containing protein [Hyphomicrobiaceae bacterium]|nr:HepT-like ribonuclease domain-containing protein [Hyphomicrobiaceae bacterium]
MIKRTQLVRLRDMLEAIDGVAEMTSGVDLAGYRGDFKLRKAVERCVEIVSEASRHIPATLKARFPEQPWDEIAAIGNLLRHHYQRVDDRIMWKIATRSLRDLRPVVAAMIEETEE